MRKNLMPILLIGISVLMFYFYIDPGYQRVKVLLGEQGQYVEALERARDLNDTRDRLLVQYNNIPREELLELERMIPDKLNTVKLVADIDGVASKYGIAVRGIVVNEQIADQGQSVGLSNGPSYNTTTITFRFAATYEDLTRFLRDLEGSLQLIDIKSITFSSNVSEDSELNEYQVSFQTYWLK